MCLKCGNRIVTGDFRAESSQCLLLLFWVGAREPGIYGSPATLVSGRKTPDSALRGINSIVLVYQQFTQPLQALSDLCLRPQPETHTGNPRRLLGPWGLLAIILNKDFR